MKSGRMALLAMGVLAWMVAVIGAMAADSNSPAFRYGGDIRIREEAYDHIPPGLAERNYFRFRTRVWGEVDPLDDVTLRLRMANEFRHFLTPSQTDKPQVSSYECPDEFVIDNLYLEWRNLFGAPLSLRVGRQDLWYGNGRVIMEGNAGDGSRTLYFNAVKATWKGKKTTADLFGIFNEAEDELAINSSDRNLNAYSKAIDDVTESGAGLYIINTSVSDLIVEGYSIFKQESTYDQKATAATGGGYAQPTKAWQTLDSASGTVGNPDLNLYTFGCRFVPTFNKYFSGNFEQAVQIGDRGSSDVLAWMADWYVDYKLPIMDSIKPALQVGAYCMSGDDPCTEDDEGWNALWARGAQQELYLYALEDFRWSNLAIPHVDLSITPSKNYKGTLAAYYLAALEDDGPGDGKERGWRWQFKNEFTLAEGLIRKTDKLTGHLWFEMLEPGDYYLDNMDTAYFARWQLMYTF